MRSKLRRLERAARGHLDSFELRDGNTYYYDRLETTKELFLHSVKCLGADSLEDWPAPPEIYMKLLEARAPAAVLASFDPPGGPAFAEFPYDRDTLVSERRLAPLFTGPVEDLSQ